MRDILFRGKRIDNDKWVKGCLIFNKEKSYAAIGDECETSVITPFDTVFPETVGQYTGLTDKNGKRIFEGDIIVVKIKGYYTICKVAWADNVAQFQLWQRNTIPNTPTNLDLGNYDCEIIGNIHDNPDLLKGGDTE